MHVKNNKLKSITLEATFTYMQATPVFNKFYNFLAPFILPQCQKTDNEKASPQKSPDVHSY